MAQVGFGFIGLVAAIPGIIIFVLGASAGGAGAVIAIAIGVGWIALVSVVISTLTAIFQMALYIYATTGQVPMGFENAGITDTFHERSQGSLMRGFGGGSRGFQPPLLPLAYGAKAALAASGLRYSRVKHTLPSRKRHRPM